MNLVGLSKLGNGEVFLILALLLILAAKRIPPAGAKWFTRIRDGFLRAYNEFENAIREMTGQESPSHPVLMILSFVLGITCLVLIGYEFFK